MLLDTLYGRLPRRCVGLVTIVSSIMRCVVDVSKPSTASHTAAVAEIRDLGVGFLIMFSVEPLLSKHLNIGSQVD